MLAGNGASSPPLPPAPVAPGQQAAKGDKNAKDMMEKTAHAVTAQWAVRTDGLLDVCLHYF